VSRHFWAKLTLTSRLANPTQRQNVMITWRQTLLHCANSCIALISLIGIGFIDCVAVVDLHQDCASLNEYSTIDRQRATIV